MAELPTVFTIKDLVSRYSITPSGLRTWIGKLKARGYDMEPAIQEGQPVYNAFHVEMLDALRNHIRRGRAVSSFPRQDSATKPETSNAIANSNGVVNSNAVANSNGAVNSKGVASPRPTANKISKEVMDSMLEAIRDEAERLQDSYSLRELVSASYEDLNTVIRVHGYSYAIALFEKHGVSIKAKTLQQYLSRYRLQQKRQTTSA